jgi:ubiquinone/menaquinone biosynthesis C-methylase UbiE
MSNLQRLIPSSLRPAAKTIYYKLFRLQLGLRCWCIDRLGTPQVKIPVPPAMLRFRVSELTSVHEFLRIGAGCADFIQRYFSGMGMDLASAHRVLDFGCGCGRTIRWFAQGGGKAEFHGVDVDAEAVAWCRGHLHPGRFLVTAPAPPLPYPAQYFDAIYCLSVFTHLDEPMQDMWLPELKRILKPGGLLLVTIHGKAATKGLDREGERVLRTRGFVHRRSQKLRGLVPDWYQTSWHSREYIVNRLSEYFGDVHYHVVSGGSQDVVMARRAA